MVTARPPRAARALLALITARSPHAYLLGDLEEEFHSIAQELGLSTARCWYWNQTVRSAFPLLRSRLSSESMVRSVGAAVLGAVAAVAMATTFGGMMNSMIGADTVPTLGLVALVGSACALLSSFFAGWVSTLLIGNPYRWALVFMGLVVVTPDIVYTVLHRFEYPIPWVYLPSLAAVAAAVTGLVLGHKLGRHIHFYA